MKQRRGIRRIIIRAGIFLLLGAIVNVAVAWMDVCVPIVRVTLLDGGEPLPEDQAYWHEHAPEAIRELQIQSPLVITYGVGYVRKIGGDATQAREGGLVALWTRILAGWPATCLRGECWSYSSNPSNPFVVNRGTIKSP